MNLYLHTERAKYVGNFYEKANNLMMKLYDPSHHNWNNNCQPIWGKNPFPDYLLELFLDDWINDEEPEKLEILNNDSSCDKVDRDNESDSEIFMWKFVNRIYILLKHWN